MKTQNLKLFSLSLILSAILSIFMCNVTLVRAQTNSAEIVICANSGRILYQSNANQKMGMASTTKIVTCITVIDNYDLSNEITIKKEWTGIEGSSIYLKEGEVFTVEELLYALMLRSGNDCAVTLASALAGSIENFCKLMNEKAISVGAFNSNFKNPHGLDHEEHYTTAYDLALITKYAMKNPIFRKIVGCKQKTIGEGESRRVLINKNKMLSEYDGSTGVKTGYTKKCGRCLVSSADKDGFELICVVLNCPPMFERSKQLMNDAYNEYENCLLASKDVSVCEVTAKNGQKIPAYVDKDIYYPLTKDEKMKVKKVITPFESNKIFNQFAFCCGTIDFFIENHLLFCEKIYTILG